MNIINLAKHVINYCLDIDRPISNLQLQKILYFVEGEFYQAQGYWLTEAKFYAWKFGPVNKEVYSEYCVYGGGCIYERTTDVIDEHIKSIIDPIINKYAQMTASSLVEKSHRKGGAWYKVYDGNNNTEIERIYIQNEFKPN